MFRQCDLSGCGGFNECELIISCQKSRDIASFFGLPQRVHKEDGSLDMLAKIFKAIDVNEDHEIDWEEFCDFFSKRILAVMTLQGQQPSASYGSHASGLTSCGNSGTAGLPYDNPYADAADAELLLTSQSPRTPKSIRATEPAVESPQGRERVRAGTCLAVDKCEDCGERLGLLFGFHGLGALRRRHAAICAKRKAKSAEAVALTEGAPQAAARPQPLAASSEQRKGTPAVPQVGTMNFPHTRKEADNPDENKSFQLPDLTVENRHGQGPST